MRRTKPIELWLTRHVVRTLFWGLRWLPDGAIPALGAVIGGLCYTAMPRYRRVARANLQRAFGDAWSPAEIERLIRRNFRHCGRTLAEFLAMAGWNGPEIERRVELRGIDRLDAALAQGRGVIVVTAHYGNWELMAARVARAGYPVHVIARDADDRTTNALINQIRTAQGYRVISRRYAMRPALECLRKGELLGILLDQNTISGEVYVDFFGHPAATATGPAVLARRTGAPLVPVFARRRPDGTHVAEFLPPLVCAVTEDKERDLWETTARLTQVIEAQIRAEPEQWVWIHNRWKKAAPGSALRAPGWKGAAAPHAGSPDRPPVREAGGTGGGCGDPCLHE